MKVGISVKLDVTKIDKNRLFKGEKGTYLDLTTFVDLAQVDQYGNNGFISQSVSKEEREQGMQGAILGNVKVFHKSMNVAPEQTPQQTAMQAQAPQHTQPDDLSQDIPF